MFVQALILVLLAVLKRLGPVFVELVVGKLFELKY